MSSDTSNPNTLDVQTFASTMGQAVWLMTLSEAHKDLPIRAVEERVAPALLLRQFKLDTRKNRLIFGGGDLPAPH